MYTCLVLLRSGETSVTALIKELLFLTFAGTVHKSNKCRSTWGRRLRNVYIKLELARSLSNAILDLTSCKI